MGRKRGFTTRMKSNLKRKATKSRNDLAYMLLWGEEPPKKHNMISKKKPKPLF